MSQPGRERIGFTCAYAPLALIDAAGFVPYRILPLGDAPDRAGSILHDNLCPHVKRVLDRGLTGDLPELAGLVVMNSCDTMRRLADAWHATRPDDRFFDRDLNGDIGHSIAGSRQANKRAYSPSDVRGR